MNKHHSTNKSTYLAILFFGIMTAIGCNAANAQDTINPLLSTSGPNVMNNGSLQWNTQLEWDHMRSDYEDLPMNIHLLGATTGFRLGVGSRAELTLGFMTNHVLGTLDSHQVFSKNIACAPSVGAKLLLYEGKGWLPRVAFKTDIALAYQRDVYGRNISPMVQPSIGLAFRNNLGKRWVVDYNLNLTWNSFMTQLFNGSLYVRWLATDKLLVSAGFSSGTWNSPFRGDFELRYQATPNLQCFLQGSYAAGNRYGSGDGYRQAHVLTGISWNLK